MLELDSGCRLQESSLTTDWTKTQDALLYASRKTGFKLFELRLGENVPLSCGHRSFRTRKLGDLFERARKLAKLETVVDRATYGTVLQGNKSGKNRMRTGKSHKIRKELFA